MKKPTVKAGLYLVFVFSFEFPPFTPRDGDKSIGFFENTVAFVVISFLKGSANKRFGSNQLSIGYIGDGVYYIRVKNRTAVIVVITTEDSVFPLYVEVASKDYIAERKENIT